MIIIPFDLLEQEDKPLEITVTDLGTLVLAIATTLSLIYISRQVNVTRQQTKGQFLLALDEQLEKFNEITLHLINEPSFMPAGVQWGQVWRLMSVFERINIMVEDRILDVALVDRLYGFRLIAIIGNDAIFDRLKLSGGEWQDFIDLCYAVADHRMQSENVIDVDRAFKNRVYQLNKNTRRLNDPFSFERRDGNP